MNMDEEPLLFIHNLSKEFGPIKALKNVSINFRRGEIHIILGENGAGKTTLAKILAGIYRIDSGDIILDGRKIRIRNTKDSLKNGIAIVSQYPKLIEQLTVAENLLLAMDKYGYLNTTKSIEKDAKEIINRYGLNIDLNKKVYTLSFSERQRVEILKALLLKPKVLILDEPTTLLTDKEKLHLYKFINSLRNEGRLIIVITHRIDEALNIGDRITILRNGEVITTIDKKNANKEMIIHEMFGATVEKEKQLKLSKRNGPGDTVLSVVGVDIYDDYGNKILENITLELREGEIHGVFGLAGSGLKELGETLYGLREYSGGKITILGQDLRRIDRDEMANMVGYIPDNILKSLILDLNIEQNYRVKQRLWRIQENYMEHIINKFRIKAESLKQNAGTLSGGNLQKLAVSREIILKPKILIAVNPTKALDHISIETLHNIFMEYINEGGSILLLSEDINEVIDISDIVSVITKRKLRTLERGINKREHVLELLA